MCLAFPGQIKSKNGDKSIIDFAGVEREIVTALVDANVGDYVLVHAGLAISKIEQEDAWEALKIYEQNRRNNRENK